jgi:hypothetical protein
MRSIVVMILAASVAGCLTSADYAVENGSNGTAAAGETGLTVSQSEIARLAAMLRDQLRGCWTPPAGIAGGPTVRVHFELNQDGTLARDPVVLPDNSGDAQDASSRRPRKVHCAPSEAARRSGCLRPGMTSGKRWKSNLTRERCTAAQAPRGADPAGRRHRSEHPFCYRDPQLGSPYLRKSNVTGYSTDSSSGGIFSTSPGVCP